MQATRLSLARRTPEPAGPSVRRTRRRGRSTWRAALALALAGLILAPPAAGSRAVGFGPTADCAGTSVGFTPLPELGPGRYAGFEGGLYGGGRNEPPPGQEALARDAAAAVRPRAADGRPDEAGRTVLLSIGMSNATQEFGAFLQLARGHPALHPRLTLVDGAQGGQTAGVIKDPDANFWRVVDSRLAAAGVGAAQVQAVWLKEANARPTEPFPGHARTLAADLAAVVGVARDRFPNLRLVYLSSRIYAGYASTNLNPEPYAYESGFAVRWLIERQVAGEPGLNADPARGPVTAPVLLWGPYLWADGLTASAAGLAWRCEDFANDGTHPSAAGRAKVAERLMRFFQSDPSTRPWFLADPSGPTPTAMPSFTAAPSATAGPTLTPTRDARTPPIGSATPTGRPPSPSPDPAASATATTADGPRARVCLPWAGRR